MTSFLFKQVFAPAMVLGTFTATPCFSAGEPDKPATYHQENFNSRRGMPLNRIKTSLQDACWTFHRFDVNQSGWNPKLEGDGAMVSAPIEQLTEHSGIYTPVLEVNGDLSVSFSYTFNEDFDPASGRWISICLATPDNSVVQVLEEIELVGRDANAKSSYTTVFHHLQKGDFRLILKYGGFGGKARIAIDALTFSAPFKYADGCNTPPAGMRDRVEGRADRTAEGSLLVNDSDKDGQELTAYLVKGSAHGKVELAPDGQFSFTPARGFEGSATSFVYKTCDKGGLCSADITAHILFPDQPRASSLLDFSGTYQQDGKVELMWAAANTRDQDRFRIERSLDGRSWETSGTVDAATNPGSGKYFAYVDRVHRNTALKKDIYYRLKHEDADGKTSVSRLLIVRVYNTKTLTMISVTPDPVRNDMAVNVQLQEDAYVSMRVLNEAGVPVLYKTVPALNGTNNLLVDGSAELDPGPYMLEVIVNSNERMSVKLLKE